MTRRVSFLVCRNSASGYVMAFTCQCGALGVGWSDDAHGLFSGLCAGGHGSTVMAS